MRIFGFSAGLLRIVGLLAGLGLMSGLCLQRIQKYPAFLLLVLPGA